MPKLLEMAIQGRKENRNWLFERQNDGDCDDDDDDDDDCHHSSSLTTQTQTTRSTASPTLFKLIILTSLSTSIQASTIAALPPPPPPPSSLPAPPTTLQSTPPFQGNGIRPSSLQSLPTPTTAPNALSTAGPGISSVNESSAIAIRVGIALITIESLIIIAAAVYFIYRRYLGKMGKALLGNFTGAGRRNNHLTGAPSPSEDPGLTTLQLGFGVTITIRSSKPAVYIPSWSQGQRPQPLASNPTSFHEASAGNRDVEDAEDPFGDEKALPDTNVQQVKLYPSPPPPKENSISGKEDNGDQQTGDVECEVTAMRIVDLEYIPEKEMERDLTVLEREMELLERRREMGMESRNRSWRSKFRHESGLNAIDSGVGVRGEDGSAARKDEAKRASSGWGSW